MRARLALRDQLLRADQGRVVRRRRHLTCAVVFMYPSASYQGSVPKSALLAASGSSIISHSNSGAMRLAGSNHSDQKALSAAASGYAAGQ